MAVLGVDISTRKLAFVFVGDDESVCFQGEASASGRLAAHRFGALTQYAARTLSIWAGGDQVEKPVCRVIVEGLPYVQSRDGIVGLAKVLGMVEGQALHLGFEVEVMDGRDWKQALGLSGNANKEAIAAFALGEGFVGESQDLTDAYCIALSGVREDNRC